MNTHAFEPEIVMAYCDGQLPAAEAAEVRAHLETCADCRALAADLEQVSSQMQEWTVGEAEFAAPARPASRSWTFGSAFRPALRPWMWKSALAVTAVVVVGAIVLPPVPQVQSRKSVQTLSGVPRNFSGGGGGDRTGRMGGVMGGVVSSETQPAAPATPGSDIEMMKKSLPRTFSDSPMVVNGAPSAVNEPQTTREQLVVQRGPMVIRNATLMLVTKDASGVRETVQRVVTEQHGYIQKLESAGSRGGPRSLSATLCVPTDRLDASLTELRKLGVVDQEVHGGEEVTAQYIDLVARIDNARNTEKRLNQVLAERTGKLSDILTVEQEIARVRETIEQMSAEQRSMEKQVQFATITLQVREEAKPTVVRPPAVAPPPPPPGAGTRLWNAFVDGIRIVEEELLEDAEIVLSRGPMALVFVLILFFPVRWGARRVVQSRAWSELGSRLS